MTRQTPNKIRRTLIQSVLSPPTVFLSHITPRKIPVKLQQLVLPNDMDVSSCSLCHCTTEEGTLIGGGHGDGTHLVRGTVVEMMSQVGLHLPDHLTFCPFCLAQLRNLMRLKRKVDTLGERLVSMVVGLRTLLSSTTNPDIAPTTNDDDQEMPLLGLDYGVIKDTEEFDLSLKSEECDIKMVDIGEDCFDGDNNGDGGLGSFSSSQSVEETNNGMPKLDTPMLSSCAVSTPPVRRRRRRIYDGNGKKKKIPRKPGPGWFCCIRGCKRRDIPHKDKYHIHQNLHSHIPRKQIGVICPLIGDLDSEGQKICRRDTLLVKSSLRKHLISVHKLGREEVSKAKALAIERIDFNEEQYKFWYQKGRPPRDDELVTLDPIVQDLIEYVTGD